jgi:hypothetical protein
VDSSFSPNTSPNVVCWEEADMGSMYSSVLERGEDGDDHESECFGETRRSSSNREARIASMDGGGDDGI